MSSCLIRTNYQKLTYQHITIILQNNFSSNPVLLKKICCEDFPFFNVQQNAAIIHPSHLHPIFTNAFHHPCLPPFGKHSCYKYSVAMATSLTILSGRVHCCIHSGQFCQLIYELTKHLSNIYNLLWSLHTLDPLWLHLSHSLLLLVTSLE